MYQNKVTLIGFRQQCRSSRRQQRQLYHPLSLATKSSYKKDDKYISHTEWHPAWLGKLLEFAKTPERRTYPGGRRTGCSREYDSKKTDTKQCATNGSLPSSQTAPKRPPRKSRSTMKRPRGKRRHRLPAFPSCL